MKRKLSGYISFEFTRQSMCVHFRWTDENKLVRFFNACTCGLRNLQAMDVEKLIVCVQSRNALWNQKSKDYHNRNVVKKLWEEVGKEMNNTAEALKTKWRTMRDNFRKELNKMQQSRSGAEGGKKPKWIYFEAMSFLTHTMTSRPSSSNISMTAENSAMPSQDDVVSIHSDEVNRNEEEKDDVIEEERDEEERDEGETNNEERKDEQRQNFRSSTGEKKVNEEKIAFQSKKKKTRNIYDRLLAVEEQKLDKLASMCSKTDNYTMDSDYMFLMSLLPQMKSLPPVGNMYMRQKIQQLFIDEQEKMLQAPINITVPYPVQPPQISPAETYPGSSNNTFTSYSSQTPSPSATYENNFRTVQNVIQNPVQLLNQPTEDTNIQGYFHTFK